MNAQKTMNLAAAIAILASALLIAGCSDDRSESEKRAADAADTRDSAAVEARERQLEQIARRHGVEVDVELDDSGQSVDRLTINHSVAGHTGQYGSNVALPEGFPDDVPVPEGLAIFANSKVPHGYMIQGRSSEDAARLQAFFNEAAVAAGWQPGPSSATGPIQQLQFDLGRRKLGVTITETGTERLVQISTIEMPQG